MTFRKIIMTVISVILAIILLIAVPIMAMRLINGISRRASIQEEAYLELNGIKQFVRIRGEDGANPVMIFIHDVPASPMGYVSSYFQRKLASKLTIINYDQRGSGRYMKIEIFSKLFILNINK